MHYEFNVSLKGRHLFATAPRSCTTLDEAKRLFVILKLRFPLSKGFKIQCTKHIACGVFVSEFSTERDNDEPS